MAVGADDEGLSPHPGHEDGPRGLARPVFGELLRRGDVVDSQRGAVLAQLTSPLAEPVDQLLAGVAVPGRGGVMDDRAPVLLEGYPAESCYQVWLAAPAGCGRG